MTLSSTQQRLRLLNDLTWKKFPVTSDGFVCLVDVMGADSSVCQAARVSYDNDQRFCTACDGSGEVYKKIERHPDALNSADATVVEFMSDTSVCENCDGSGVINGSTPAKDRDLIRYLMRHRHTTPFEMVELKFLVRVPMDCWRQWIRHRMANVNEYSTRYTEAIDSRQTTGFGEWRLQATNNKQGSGDYLGGWDSMANAEQVMSSYPQDMTIHSPGRLLSMEEEIFHQRATELYQNRLRFGIAKEQARKDLPLSTYTEAYWKCDLHNLLHFLGLRMDAHAQKEIRDYATTIGEQIVKPLFPVVWEAFEDYRLNAMTLSGPELKLLTKLMSMYRIGDNSPHVDVDTECGLGKREKDDLKKKLERMGL